MAHTVIGRHLLAMGESVEVSDGSSTIVCSLVAMVAIVIAVALCVCKESKKKGGAPDSPMLKDATPLSDRKSQINSGSPEDETAIKVETEGINRQSNGSTVRDSAEVNSRPTSHDHRALPEIPALSQTSVSQTEDEDDDGLYDVISKARQRQASGGSRVTPTATPVRTPGNNLYEKVNDVASGYTGVKNVPPESGYSGMKNPYAVVDGIGSADYAHIDEKKRTPEHRDIMRVQALGMAPQASVETLDDTSYSSVSGPPIPEKNFDLLNEENLTIASTPTSGNSPSLPPRNGTHSVVSQDAVVSVSPDGSTMVTSQNGASIITVTQDASGVSNGSSDPPKREPPYSRVTARESLANLRERQAQERMAASGAAAASGDATYESVNYDQIKSPNAGASGAPSPPIQPDRQSLTSDLYAEIPSASGENSTRSSMYARVGDVQRDYHAPTPPPVDLLKKLYTVANAEDESDPGYSMIPRARPQSAYNASSPGATANGNGLIHDVQSGALYAVVDKSRKMRATVYVSQNVEGHTHNGGDASQLYAQVNKPKRHQYENAVIPSAYIGTGARPKILPNSAVVAASPAPANGAAHSSSGSKSASDPGYQTIGSVGKEDPNYDNIPETKLSDVGSDYDPNYERVRTGGETDGVSRMQISPGVATEIEPGNNPHGMIHISNHQPQPNFWHKREHVYQEISEAQSDKDRLSQYADRTSTAL